MGWPRKDGAAAHRRVTLPQRTQPRSLSVAQLGSVVGGGPRRRWLAHVLRPVQRDMLRLAAMLVAKILDGTRPAGLPIQRPVSISSDLVCRVQSPSGQIKTAFCYPITI